MTWAETIFLIMALTIPGLALAVLIMVVGDYRARRADNRRRLGLP